MSLARPEIADPSGLDSPARFAIGETDFLLDGQPYRVISGALHYFRIHPDLWADRIHKARLMGLNTIETYVAWNAHAPSSPAMDFSGGLDLGRFLDLVAAEGMHAIVRPGPYICAEWSNGGLPAWLYATTGVGVRRCEPLFMSAVEGYFKELAPVLAPRQIDRGGPIILVQVENEYGAYGSDKDYLQELTNLTRSIGITVPLTTVDQPRDDQLDNGSLPGLHATGSFGGNVTERLATLRRHQATGPLMCSEFWDGWFDQWGEHHHRTSAVESAQSLEELLAAGGSVNIYMFHGGTNFGLNNGANHKGTYQPIVTSYDYDAPLDEAGNPTEKYWAFREVIAKFASVPDEKPQPARTASPTTATLSQAVSLWDVVDDLGEWQRVTTVPTMDEIGHYAGFTLYRTIMSDREPAVLHVAEVRDRAQVFVDGVATGVLARDHHDHATTVVGSPGAALDLLVEDLGKVDYGPRIAEQKGLIGPVTLDGREISDWRVLPIDLDRLDVVRKALDTSPITGVQTVAGPAFARAHVEVADHGDLYLDTTGWGKGLAWVNGFLLGRYWSRGPQRTMYVPGPILRPGANELVVLELHGLGSLEVHLLSDPDLGHTEP